MPRKKQKKSTGDETETVEDETTQDNKESSKNGIDNGKGLTVDDDGTDSTSIHSKSNGVSVSIKKRFSFAKRKKSVDRQDKGGQEDGSSTKRGLRLTNSLNNVRQDISTSKIPILKHKLKNVESRTGSKHELCIKTGKCESRSLVLNPGMDSWRMAGLMDTVSCANSMQTLRSTNSLSDKTKIKPSLSSSSSKNRVASLEKVKDGRPYSYTPPTTTGVSPPVVAPPVVIVCETSDPITNIVQQNPMNECNDYTNTNELAQAEQTNTATSERVVIDSLLSSNNIQNDAQETSLTCVPYSPHQERKERCPKTVRKLSEPLVVVTESIANEPVSKDEITEDIFCAGVRPEGCTSSNNDCSIIPDPCYAKEGPVVSGTVNGEVGDMFTQDLYELDGENIISVRELKDFIDEKQIQLPKSISCDDWLVLDFFHSAIASL